jgi:preprotein translocase subunit SecE
MAKTNVAEFIQQVRQELTRVTWPTRKETMVTTAMVFVMVFIAAAFFFGTGVAKTVGSGMIDLNAVTSTVTVEVPSMIALTASRPDDNSSLSGSGKSISEFLVSAGQIKKVPDYDAAIDPTFIKAVKQ